MTVSGPSPARGYALVTIGGFSPERRELKPAAAKRVLAADRGGRRGARPAAGAAGREEKGRHLAPKSIVRRTVRLEAPDLSIARRVAVKRPACRNRLISIQLRVRVPHGSGMTEKWRE
jgi:hypothetical protein